MPMNDPLGDMISRIKNAQMRNKPKVSSPGSRLRVSVLDVLKSEGYIRGYSTVEHKDGRSEVEIELKYFDGEPVIREIAQRDAAQAVLAIIGARTPGHLAAVADAGRRRIARQLGELEGGGKTLLHRQLLVVHDRLEIGAPIGKLLGQPAPPVVLLDRTLLRHP